MATYMDLGRCQFLCACKRINPLYRLYFCRYCVDIRCIDCLSHEVDSHFCPNCLENMASAEAKMRRHRCGNCFDCPSCGHTLSTRATAVMMPKSDDPGKTSAQRAFYLTCGFCRWSTRDSGIPDQRQSTGGWQELSNPHSERISELIDSYHHLAVKEKAERDLSKFVRKRNYMLLLERYPVLNPRLRRYCSSSLSTPIRDTEPEKKVSIPASEAPIEPPIFDIEPYVTQPLQLNKITTVYQRHLAPQVQPKLTAQLQPHAKCLVVKRCMRCRTCEHNLSKADFNPSSIKFRINMNAMLHVPELRFVPFQLASDDQTRTLSAKDALAQQRKMSTNLSATKTQHLIHFGLIPGKTQQIVITLCNPAHRITTVSLRQLTADEEVKFLSHLVSGASDNDPVNKVVHQATEATSEMVSSGEQSESLVRETGDEPCFSTVRLTLPPVTIQLAPRNDIAEYDGSINLSASDAFKDDPKYIAFRRGNKVGLNVGLTPLTLRKTCHSVGMMSANLNKDLGPENQDLSRSTCMPLRAAVRLSFDYRNTTPSLLSEHRAAQVAASAAASASASATSAVKAGKDSVESENASSTASTPTNASVDQVHKIELVAIFDFGEMSLVL